MNMKKKTKQKNDFKNPIVNAHCTFESIFLSTVHISSQFQINCHEILCF